MLQSDFRNKLIGKFSEADFATLATHIEPVELKVRDCVVQAGRKIAHVYFPESGQLSVLAKVPHAEPIEVGLFGREGMSDMVPDFRTPFDTIVQVPGPAHRIPAELFSELALTSRALADLTSRYHRATLAQLSFTALSHGSFTVAERLARWILMVHDRTDGDEVPLVHEFFAWMLAVRRAGVTEAMTELRNQHAIETKRGRLVVLDRQILIELASGSYGPAEAEYSRLLGVSPSNWS